MNFKNEIAKILVGVTNLEFNDIVDSIEVPQNSEMGDFAFPCFKLSKEMKKAPNMIASELAEKIKPNEFIEKIEPVSGYLNFYVNKEFLANVTLKMVIEVGESYGKNEIGKGKTVVIDYSSPNIAKPFHIGHLRATVIGNALYNIYKMQGYNVIGINHLGDWGTQFGKLMVAYKKYSSQEALDKGGIKELVRIYVKFHELAEQDESLNDEARNYLLKMQQGDKDALDLWRYFYDISMIEFNAVYDRLGTKFDYTTGESFYNEMMWPIVEELEAKNLLVESDGAKIVDLEEAKMPPCLILRSDGGTLYPTRDISAAKYRKETFNFDKCLYVTGLEQNLHFAQWFKVIEFMGYDWAKDLTHIPFGMVSLKEGKLSTRAGNVIYMNDLFNEAVEKTRAIIEEKNPDLENKDEVAEAVGLGAVIFNDLYNNRIKDVVFSWERMLSFEGETAPYVQYTHARATSILNKAGNVDFNNIDYSILTDPATNEIIKLLYNYSEKIAEAANKNEPFVITRYLVSLAQAFNKFYHDNPIITEAENVKNARLVVVNSVKNILKSGLALIGIKAPNKM
ncbi:MAG: arginine--tRNA ligase [Defluviitaleaceae bacterium]|nr:arginine--tRNA ligase [Defluviitaleaceae bacterium]